MEIGQTDEHQVRQNRNESPGTKAPASSAGMIHFRRGFAIFIRSTGRRFLLELVRAHDKILKMSSETQEILDIFEKLSEAKRLEMTDFGRFLLAQNERMTDVETTERWFATAKGAAKVGMTTDAIMTLTRGES